jgi:hypothetical protein
MGLTLDPTYLFLGLLIAAIFAADEIVRTRRESRRWKSELENEP